MVGGKRTNLGTYNTLKEAAVAYDRAVHKANQSTSLLNFPDMVHNLDVEPKYKRRKLSSTSSCVTLDTLVTHAKRVQKKSSGSVAAVVNIESNNSLSAFDTLIGAALAYDQATKEEKEI